MSGQELRSKTRAILEEIINDSYISKNLETGIYNYTIWKTKTRHQQCLWECEKFTNIYKNKVKQVCANLIPDSYVGNTSLIKKLKNGDFRPHMVAFMKPTELFPEKWQTIIDDKAKRDNAMAEVDQSMATEMFYCPRCGNNKTVYYESQTRSSDESASVFITCLVCAKRWKKN
jgi:DNA-directed RNA polymerase subunit M/transcription elongation factor TFIIS